MNPDVHTLTGAYALNALGDDEREVFERHLEDCQDCVQEVAELRLTANRLGAAVSEQPPAALKQSVLAEISRTRQDSPVGPRLVVDNGPVAPRGPRRWMVAVTSVAAAVALAAAVTFGVATVNTQHQLDAARSQLATADANSGPVARVLSAADAQVTSANGVTGGTATAVVSRKLNEGVLMAFGMAAAPADKSLQAWAIGPDGKHSLGFVVPGPTGTAAPILMRNVDNATVLGVTVEPAGGSPQPTTTPVMLLTMPA